MEHEEEGPCEDEAKKSHWSIKKDLLKLEFFRIQAYWSRKAKEKGIFTESDLEKHLGP